MVWVPRDDREYNEKKVSTFELDSVLFRTFRNSALRWKKIRNNNSHVLKLVFPGTSTREFSKSFNYYSLSDL